MSSKRMVLAAVGAFLGVVVLVGVPALLSGDRVGRENSPIDADASDRGSEDFIERSVDSVAQPDGGDRLALLNLIDSPPRRIDHPEAADLTARAGAIADRLSSDVGPVAIYESSPAWGNAESLGFGELTDDRRVGIWWFEIDDQTVFTDHLRSNTETHLVASTEVGVTIRLDGVHVAFYEAGVYVQFMVSAEGGTRVEAAEGEEISVWMLGVVPDLITIFRGA